MDYWALGGDPCNVDANPPQIMDMFVLDPWRQPGNTQPALESTVMHPFPYVY
jgi:hypothetical protein